MRNESGVYSREWDRSRVITQAVLPDKFVFRFDGFLRLTRRNRMLLRYYNPILTSINYKMPHGSYRNFVSHEFCNIFNNVDSLCNGATTGQPDTGQVGEQREVITFKNGSFFLFFLIWWFQQEVMSYLPNVYRETILHQMWSSKDKLSKL